jgi:hypothetical protein
MGRTIRRQDNSFLKALLKLIPSEVVAVFIFLQGILPAALVPPMLLYQKRDDESNAALGVQS